MEPKRSRSKLKAKVLTLKEQLKVANHRIDDLEKENKVLVENSTNLERELTALKSECDALKRPSTVHPRLDGNSSAARSYHTASHSMQLKKLSSEPLQLVSSTIDSTSSFAPPNDPIHRMPKLQAPTPSSPSSDRRDAKPMRSLTTAKVTFSDSVTTIGSPKRHRKRTKKTTQLFEIIADALPNTSPDSPSLQDDALPHFNDEDAKEVIEKMRDNEVLEDEQIMAFAEMYFDKNPLILDFILKQPLDITYGSQGAASTVPTRLRANSEGSTSHTHVAPLKRANIFASPKLSQDMEDGPRDPWIRFNMPTARNPTELFKSPCSAFQEQADVLRFVNRSSSEVYVNINTFPCQGAFFGFSMSRSRLLPHQDCRINLTLVGNALKTCSALVLISLVQRSSKTTSVSSATSSNEPLVPTCSQYYAFSCEVEMTKPKIELNYWKFNLAELKEHSNEISKTPTAIISAATLQGAALSCRKFISQSNVMDFGFFSRFLEIASRLPIHPNLISVIGASDKRPYRILSPAWTCNLSASLMATCTRGSLEASEVGGEFPALNVLNSFSHGGELRSWLNSHRSPPDAPLLADLSSRLAIAQDIVAAVQELHAHHIIHRDLSTNSFGLVNENCAILVELNSCLEVKGKFAPLASSALRWSAPELTSSGGHTYESDIYSIGVILLDLAVGAPLSTTIAARGFASFHEVCQDWHSFLNGSDSAHTDLETETSTAPSLASGTPLQRLATLINCCCSNLPSSRPSLETISNHLGSICDASKSSA